MNDRIKNAIGKIIMGSRIRTIISSCSLSVRLPQLPSHDRLPLKTARATNKNARLHLKRAGLACPTTFRDGAVLLLWHLGQRPAVLLDFILRAQQLAMVDCEVDQIQHRAIAEDGAVP
jgi:hypothetical protein